MGYFIFNMVGKRQICHKKGIYSFLFLLFVLVIIAGCEKQQIESISLADDELFFIRVQSFGYFLDC